MESPHFGLEICDRDGDAIGSLHAVVCESTQAFFQADRFSADDWVVLAKLPAPVVYLKTLRIDNQADRGSGFGSAAMQQFIAEAIRRGGRTAFAKVADEETPQDILTAFYRKNGWTTLPQDAQYARLAWLDLAQVPSA